MSEGFAAAHDDEMARRADVTAAAWERSWIEDGVRVVRVPDTEDGRVVELDQWRAGFCAFCSQPCLGGQCDKCAHGSMQPAGFWNEDDQ
jgi:hypothetical protein